MAEGKRRSTVMEIGGRPVIYRGRVLESRLSGKFVSVYLVEGNELACPDLRGYERERDRLYDKMRAGRTHDGAGAPELGALIKALPLILPAEGGVEPGAFDDLLIRYELNGCFRHAYRLYDEATADPRRALLERAVVRTLYWPRDEWTPAEMVDLSFFELDVPVDQLEGRYVASGRQQRWTFPIAPDWKETVHAAGLSVVCGKLVCGRDPQDPDVLYVVARRKGLYQVCKCRYDAVRRSLSAVREEPPRARGRQRQARPGPAVSPARARPPEKKRAKGRAKGERRTKAAGRAPGSGRRGKRARKKKESEEILVLCTASGEHRDLLEEQGVLVVDRIDSRPDLAVFEPDDADVPGVEIPIQGWIESGDHIRIRDEDDTWWRFRVLDDVEYEHPLNR